MDRAVRRSVAHAPRDLSNRAHRRLIGVLGIFLPLFLYIVAGMRPTTGIASWKFLPSVSAYYYTGAVAIFVGVLFALSLFLLSYRGYEGVITDRVVGGVGGCAALGVALFPTAPPIGISPPSWWTTGLQAAHYVSAFILFLSFITFAIWLFRKSNIPRNEDRDLDKRTRNSIYLACGIVMIIGLLWAGSSMITHASIFWAETLAIVAFAVSWLVKGEADVPVREAIRRIMPRSEKSGEWNR